MFKFYLDKKTGETHVYPPGVRVSATIRKPVGFDRGRFKLVREVDRATFNTVYEEYARKGIVLAIH